MKRSKGTRLRDLGFDLTKYDRSDNTYHVRCSQCEATVINGVPCHERGCPNEHKEDK
jgi:hypothetical protein